MFYHQKKTETSPECDKRVDGRSDLYLYERTGLPVYLSLQYESVYKLFIGFPAVGLTVLQKAQDKLTIIDICGEKIKVSLSTFYPDALTLIPVNKVPLYGKNFTCSVSPNNYILQKKWSNYADGFSSDGAIFSIMSGGGKKTGVETVFQLEKNTISYHAVSDHIIRKYQAKKSVLYI